MERRRCIAMVEGLVLAALFLVGAGAASAGNREDCERYCKTHPDCVKCDTDLNCGIGFERMERFRGPGGRNYSACRRSKFGEASQFNRTACETWCKGDARCKKCSDRLGCGTGFESLKSFGGRGENWHACAQSSWGAASEENKARCLAWCARPYVPFSHDGTCHMCSESPTCGGAFKNIKTFSGKGKNWYACERTGSINRVWRELAVVRPRHATLVVSVGGFHGYRMREGFEWFCDDFFRHKERTNEPDPTILCVSSFASTTTRSEQLADNIRDTAAAMERQLGRRPKIILVGKSMGGCKLHHAVTERSLKNVKIDLFVGVDMSCGVACHAKMGARDALTFGANTPRIFNFYQLADAHKTAGQCGHLVLRAGKDVLPSDAINVDVGKSGFRVDTEKPGGPSMCAGGHLQMDDCGTLKHKIVDLVRKVASER